jgi:hypothetical protein
VGVGRGVLLCLRRGERLVFFLLRFFGGSSTRSSLNFIQSGL